MDFPHQKFQQYGRIARNLHALLKSCTGKNFRLCGKNYLDESHHQQSSLKI